MKRSINVIVPDSYPYKVTSRDKKQFIREMDKILEQLYTDKYMDDLHRKEILSIMPELFWRAKILNKKKFSHKK